MPHEQVGCSCVPYEPRDCSTHGKGAINGKPAPKPKEPPADKKKPK